MRERWAVEDDALALWHRADAADAAALTACAEVEAAGRRQVEAAMRPFTPSTWRRAIARETRQEWHRNGPDPRLVARVGERVERARARAAVRAAAAETQVAAAWAERTAATLVLRAIWPDVHWVLGLTRNALTRMARDHRP
jgi:hypothetical protein